MAEAKSPEQRALAHISNKIDECYVKIEHMEELLKKRLTAPPRPKADAENSALFAENSATAAAA